MDWNNPVLSVLSTSHEDTASFKVNVLDACQSEFGYPHSAGIKDTEENRHDHPAVGTFRWNRLAFVYCLEKAPEFIRCINVGIILRGGSLSYVEAGYMLLFRHHSDTCRIHASD